jgi:hypothetical protein
VQFEAAVAAAPYLHPRLAASSVNASVKGEVAIITPEQRQARIAALQRKLLGASDATPVIDGTVDAAS